MIKGETKIELTHVKTGEKEVYTEENMTTNFFKDILNFKFRKADFYSSLFPLYKKGLGGIFLFGENIEEDKNNYLPPANANLVGYAGSEAYMGTNTLKGSFNEAESGELENGYRFVWDFGTSQANGEIKCLSLTHAKGGSAGLGSKMDEEKSNCENLLEMVSISNTEPTPSYYKDLDYGYTIALNSSSTGITISKYLDNLNLVTLKSDERIVANKAHDFQLTAIRSSYLYLYQNDSYFYILASTNDNKMKLGIINKATLDMEKLVDLSQHYNLMYYVKEFVVIGDYLYFCKTAGTAEQYYSIATAYKINLNNQTDILEFDGVRYYSRSGYSNSENLNVIGDYCGRFLTTLFIIDQNDVMHRVTWNFYPQETIKNIYKNIIYWNIIRRDGSSSAYGNYFLLLTTYLATINNLSTPVTKTADKTMKITYVVTEV